MKIKYRLANGKTVEVEVTEAQAEVIVDIDRKFDSNERKFSGRATKELSLERFGDESGWEPTDETADIEAEVEQADESERVREAVSTLNARQRELVRLHFYDGKTVREIAAIFGIHHSNVVRQIEVIKKALKKIL